MCWSLDKDIAEAKVVAQGLRIAELESELAAMRAQLAAAKAQLKKSNAASMEDMKAGDQLIDSLVGQVDMLQGEVSASNADLAKRDNAVRDLQMALLSMPPAGQQ